tara:strand:+ start:538 stop:762 length:225 start_codon:yes stop_codon:yes gene_type:complete
MGQNVPFFLYNQNKDNNYLFGVKTMRLLYLLPIFSINLFAHITNDIHVHLNNFFLYFSLITLVVFIRVIYRRFV